jgi:Domain of unknown function (DUF3597)
MSAWLLQQRFDTHDKTWHFSPGVGHNECLLHHRCGGRDSISRSVFGPASKEIAILGPSQGGVETRTADAGDKNDSAAMNIWLHKQIMKKLAENAGKVPAELQH